MKIVFNNETEESIGVPKTARSSVWQVISYFLLLLLLGNLGTPGATGLANIPINFFLKDQLKLGPERVALFGFWVGIPAYGGIALGMLRDRWQPLGGKDRGYLLVLPVLIAGIMFWLSTQPLTYGRLLAVMLVVSCFGVLLLTAMQGLMAAVAYRYAAAGRLSAVFNIAALLPTIVASYAGGWLTAHTRPQTVFQVAGGVILLVPALLLWKPRGVYADTAPHPIETPKEPLRQQIARLARHRPLYLPAIIWFLWYFAPGWNTPLFFYLTERIKLSSETYGTMLSIQSIATLVFVLFYGRICSRFPLRRLLWAGFLLALAGGPLYWFIRTPLQAYLIGALTGASCGVAGAAFFDLVLRSCPKGSEGVTVALNGGAAAFAWATADVFGSWLYVRGGFALALIVTMLTSLPTIVALWALPEELIRTREGEPYGEEVFQAMPQPSAL